MAIRMHGKLPRSTSFNLKINVYVACTKDKAISQILKQKLECNVQKAGPQVLLKGNAHTYRQICKPLHY
eukprot:scaffold411520_cov18-Prasinocladus_malaysianus.AAC.1